MVSNSAGVGFFHAIFDRRKDAPKLVCCNESKFTIETAVIEEQHVDCKDEAMRLAVDGEFDAVGKLEYYLLRSLGLSADILSSMSVAAVGDWPSNLEAIRTFATWNRCRSAIA